MASPTAAAAAAAAAAAPPSFPPGTAHVDGSMLEGGGQILRNAVALSAVLSLPVAITKIRAGRDRPGLAPQHATGLRLARSLCGGGAALEGCEPRSTAVRFAPGPARGPVAGEGYEADTGTAGSCTLLVQQALPLLLFATRGGNGGRKRARQTSGDGGPATTTAAEAPPTSRVVLRGGTDASHAPPIGYLERVLAPILNAWLGSGGGSGTASPPPIAVSLARRGFYPRGGGEVRLGVRALPEGSSLPPLPAHQLSDTPSVVAVDIYAFAAGKVRADAASRAAEGAAGPISAALAALAAANDNDNPPVPVRLHTEHLAPGSGRAVGDSAGVTCVATTTTPGQVLGASASGERGLRAEDMGSACGRALARQLCSGAGADEWLVDQLVVLMALAEGKSSVLCAAPLSLHARTAVAVAERLTAAAAAARGPRGKERAATGVVFRQTPVEGSQERAAEAARRAGIVFEPGEPGSEGLVLLECEGVGAVAGGGAGALGA
jgi:RNA 3'-terminal phosphate cyclase (ATP)